MNQMAIPQNNNQIMQQAMEDSLSSLLDAELLKLREENESLKQQVVSLATSASCFTKTLLGLDLASRVGSLLTVEGGRVVSWNSALRESLGYDQSDLFTMIKSIRDLIDEDDASTVLTALIDAVMSKKETLSISFNMRHKTGRKVAVQYNALFSYDAKSNKPMFSIGFVSFGVDPSDDYSFTQQLQLFQVQSSRQKNVLAGRDANA